MTGTTTDETKTYRRGVSARAGCTVSEHRGQILRPTDAAIEPGSTITWTNNGALPHAVTADDGSFDSGRLNPGDSYKVALDGQGTVTYFCAVYPEMRGSATVGVGGGGGGTASAEQPSSEDMSEAKDTRDSY
jgi:plastocyanin